MSKSKPDPCKKLACAIQKCLSENNFQESCCTKHIDNLRECCKKYYEFSLVCSGMKPIPEVLSALEVNKNNGDQN